MDPLSLAVGVGGDIVGGLFGAQGASAQRNWEERMMNTQYQRAAEDMRKAGLNPLMMYQKGGGPVGGIPTPPNIGEKIGEGVSSAAKAATVDIPLAKSQVAAQAAAAEDDRQAALLKAKQQGQVDASVIQMGIENQRTLVQMEQMRHQMDLTDKQREELDQQIAELKSRILLQQKQADLTSVNARKGSVEAGALELLTPLIKSAKDGLDAMRAGRGSYPNEDIRPPSYIRRTKGSADSSSRGVTPGGESSAKSGWQQLKEAGKEVWDWWKKP
ncbi:MAG: DNA pilot protein [Microvirus sp.]|nr:MAG: DNA pilot protein [Microvirus sp.]